MTHFLPERQLRAVKRDIEQLELIQMQRLNLDGCLLSFSCCLWTILRRITHHGGYSLLWGLWWSWPTWAPCSTEGARLSPSKILHFWQEQQAHQVQFYQKAVEQPGITGNGVSNETVHQNGSSVYKENGSEGKLISAETAEEVEEPLMFNTRKESQLTAIKSWTRSWDLTLG